MPPLLLGGLVPPPAAGGEGAAARRLRRKWLIDAAGTGGSAAEREARARLLNACVRLCADLRVQAAPGLEGLADWLGVGPGELVASPFGLRAAALGIAAGARIRHVERAPLWRWRQALRSDALAPGHPEGPGGELCDPDHGEWRDGSLQLGRYQGFLLDGPHASLHPNHSARWTPHELLHRAVGFAHRKAAGRLWIAIGARLGELLPVVHWYGPDQVARLDGLPFERLADAAAPAAPLAAAAWWHAEAGALPGLLDGSLHRLGLGAAALEAELVACAFAHTRGAWPEGAEALRMLDPGLDARSDAQAYAAGHARRLRDPAVDDALTRHTALGRERFDELGAFAEAIEIAFDALIFGSIVLHPAAIAVAAARRDAWEAALYAAVCGATLPTSQTGLDPASRDAAHPHELARGAEAVAPALSHWLMATGLLDSTLRLAGDGRRGPLLLRLEQALCDQAAGADGAAAERLAAALGLARWQIALAGATRRDDACECLGEDVADDAWLLAEEADDEKAPGDDGGSDRLWASAAFRRHDADFDVAAWHTALEQGDDLEAGLWPPPGWRQRHSFLVGAVGGAVVAIAVPPVIGDAWEALACAEAEGLEVSEAFAHLIAAIDAWEAAPRRRAERERLAEQWLDELRRAGAVAMVRGGPG